MPAHEVQAALDAALAQVVVKGKAPVLLRLAFHDAGTFDKAAGNGGMNASIGFELDRPESFGLKRGWNLVIRLEESLKGTPAEGQVSRADLIALMGAAAVSVTGGPRIAVPIGRSDALGPDPGVMSRGKESFTGPGRGATGTYVVTFRHLIGCVMESSFNLTEGRLPAETLTAPLLKEIFQSKGLSVREMVALSGAHTIGG
jgi:L-ascorbate peroxidase